MCRLLRSVMQDTINIYDISKSVNGEGYETTTRTLALTTIGQLSAPNGNERQLIQALVDSGRENTEVIKLTLPYGTTIAINQEVGTSDGKYWNVIFTGTSQTYTAAVEVLLYRRIVNNQVVD